MIRSATWHLAFLGTAAACAPDTAPAQSPTTVPADTAGAIIPAGFGQLNQDVITLKLRLPALEIRFTPLDERVLRLLSNDGYQSLTQLRERNRRAIDSITTRMGEARPGLVLVSFFGLAPNASFDPSVLMFESRNRIYRPIGFLALSANFSAHRLDAREQAMGIVLYGEPIPVTEPFTVQYFEASTDEWQRRLTRFERERARIQASAANARNQERH